MTADLRHLRAFLAIAASGTITRAAAELHVTQPALSRTLRQLEEHLGFRLVDRSTHHLELTAAGQAFRIRAAAAVAAVDDVLDPARAGTWPLRLGHAWSALGVHTTTLLRRWKQEHPQTPLHLLRVDERDAGLARGVVDAAIVRGIAELPGAEVLPLFTESRLAAVPVDSPLAGRPSLTLAELSGEPIAVNTIAGITGLDLWPSGITPAAKVEVTNTDDWLATIIAGRAVGLTSTATPVMYSHPAVVYIPVPDAPSVPVHLAWHNPPSHPAVLALATLAQSITA
ncbi:DNA-binding transcriptional LysR family regulator [Actinoplanes lutulentus]|uniref:DNA-binding transcriptional LysR family regulator n=1 Tax=Actinoplanes lutulentus TaxID=1287878 RepID=A0A327Z8D0_9ACTN|nr:LysR family transcriptional regulator [Actinoplanes lutulentus]MBB2949240.1 DNA-binding transcriptional LysR family regulator [Actinoplanes lutulentus]RAK34609.1 DNA-binding transcriptional LysR family regulator [Actinoplanes lutulentus]